MDKHRRANRALWDEWTHIHMRSKLYRLEEFKTGANILNQLEINEVGPVANRSMLHLQCHFGMDTLSWANKGARVTGIDFSEQAIIQANRLSVEMNLPARFICCDLYDLPDHLSDTFDIVFSSYGILAWLPDLKAWAEIISNRLKTGGFFYLAELHPFTMMLDGWSVESQLRVNFDYFDQQAVEWPTQGSYADPDAKVVQPVSYQWQHPLAEVIDALLQTGLKLEFFHEHDFTTFQQYPFMVEHPDHTWRLPDGFPRVPLLFSLKAVKE